MSLFSYLSPVARRRLRIARLALVAALATPLIGFAQQQSSSEQQPEAPRELSEPMQQGLQKLRPLTDAKNWDGALALMNELAKIAKPGTFEEYTVNDIIGKIYLQKPDFGKAIEPLEKSLRLSDRFKFSSEVDSENTAFYLAQLYYQEASGKDKTPQQQQQYFAKAGEYAKRVIDNSKKPNAEALLFYASVLYNRAQLNPEKTDMTLLNEAVKVVQDGLVASLKPKDTFYVLLVAALQAQGEIARSAEVLETLVKQYPQNKQYWQQLFATYYTLSTDEKNKRENKDNAIRAIITVERAQALGQMNTSKDYLNLIGIYQTIGQFERAAELMENGLKNGQIENERRNWEILAASYQQINKELKAIDVLKEASAKFPETGQLDLQAALMYAGLEKIEEAYKMGQSALKKGNLDTKPHTAMSYMAYWAYEQQKFDEAIDYATKAEATPEGSKDPQLKQLKKGIQDAIEDRATRARALEAQQKKI